MPISFLCLPHPEGKRYILLLSLALFLVFIILFSVVVKASFFYENKNGTVCSILSIIKEP